jgi:pimeloyl-ACP methyl ester carboxylesterase
MNAQLQCEASIVRRRAATLAFLSLSLFGCAQIRSESTSEPDIGLLDIGDDIELRRMIVHSPKPKGVVLFLHGFPETLLVWKDIAITLSKDVEVHAFDWPGYGLSSRPSVERFSYAPKDYANVLKEYIARSRIDTSKLVIYATDIGALPALMLALDDPAVAKAIIVGDFAPFDRPQYMYPSLQSLKSKPGSDATRAFMNKMRDEILANAFKRGLPVSEQFEVSQEIKDDMARGWDHGSLSSADAFYHYYSHFTRDQNHLESNLDRLRTPVKVLWGAEDIYIKTDMGVEFARRIHVDLQVLPGVGHYPHLQRPTETVRDVRSTL